MKLLYKLEVVDEETDKRVGVIDAYSMESLLEQTHKIEHSVKEYVEEAEIQTENEKSDEEGT